MRKWLTLERLDTWIGFVVLATILIALGLSLGGVEDSQRAEQLAVIQQAVERAAVQCYALEGAYPPDVGYLERHYGVVVDHSRYFVHYEVEGSNLMPQIIVFEEAVE